MFILVNRASSVSTTAIANALISPGGGNGVTTTSVIALTTAPVVPAGATSISGTYYAPVFCAQALSFGLGQSAIVVQFPLSGICASISHSTATTAIQASRTCSITGTVLDSFGFPIGNEPIQAQLQTLNQKVTYPGLTNAVILSRVLQATSGPDGTWALSLVAPGNLSAPLPTYYTFTIQGDTFSTTSFDYAATPRDISLVRRAGPVATRVAMHGSVTDASGAPSANAIVRVSVNSDCQEIVSKESLLSSVLSSVRADAAGNYTLTLVPTANLLPEGRYYTVTEGTIAKKTITVPLSGGNVNDTIISIGGAISGYPLEYIPADLTEASIIVEPPVTVYDNIRNIRGYIARALGTDWVTLRNAVLAEPGNYAFSGGNIALRGTFTSNGLFPVYSISGGTAILPTQIATEQLTSTAGVVDIPTGSIYIQASAGIGAIIRPDSWGSTLAGVISWTTGVSNWGVGTQVNIYLPFNTTTSTNPLLIYPTNTFSIVISPADEPTAIGWPILLPYATIAPDSTGAYVASVGFATADTAPNGYRVSYSIRGGS